MTWLPLETLPGWPEAPPVSDSWMLLLLFGLPIAAGIVIAVLTFAPTLARRFRQESAAVEGREVVIAESTPKA